MELSDVAKKEIKTHMNIELGINRLSEIARYEIRVHLNAELRSKRKENPYMHQFFIHDTYKHFRFC